MVSINNLHEKSLQEIFDFVVTKLDEQGEPSMDAGGACKYYQEINGKVIKCAVGFLLPSATEEDLNFIKSVEGKRVVVLLESTTPHTEYKKLESDKKVDLLQHLQFCHDSKADYGYRAAHGKEAHDTMWKTKVYEDLCRVANDYQLNTSVLQGKFQTKNKE